MIISEFLCPSQTDLQGAWKMVPTVQLGSKVKKGADEVRARTSTKTISTLLALFIVIPNYLSDT